ncbi:MAG: rod shape-determining protein MreC [Patescibacteria group bacterium]|nr:rod shape-determining protein MreC [Patescibacteria group bacterium]
MRKNERVISAFLIFLFFLLVIFGLSRTKYFTGVNSFLEKILTPFQSATFRIFNGFPIFFDDPKSQELKKENAELVKELINLRTFEKDNKALKDQFQISYPKSQKLLPAKIIGAPGFIPGISMPENFIIDRGEKDGIKPGQVVVYENNLIGRVKKTTQNLSVVEFLSNLSSSFTARVITVKENNSQILGIIKGRGNNEMLLENVVLSENIKTNNVVTTYGSIKEDGSGYPPNLVVGKILSVDKKPSDLFQKAKVKSLVDFSKLSTVFVITSF